MFVVASVKIVQVFVFFPKGRINTTIYLNGFLDCRGGLFALLIWMYLKRKERDGMKIGKLIAFIGSKCLIFLMGTNILLSSSLCFLFWILFFYLNYS